jgi:hypothetical protein
VRLGFALALVEALLAGTMHYLGELSSSLKAGDVLNPVAISHASMNGDILLDNDRLPSSTLAMELDRFECGVSVNVVIEACFAGMIKWKIEALRSEDLFILASCGRGEKTWAYKRCSLSGITEARRS